MLWILVPLVLVALGLLALLALRLYGTVKRLSAVLRTACERVGVATAALNAAMADGPLGEPGAGRTPAGTGRPPAGRGPAAAASRPSPRRSPAGSGANAPEPGSGA